MVVSWLHNNPWVLLPFLALFLLWPLIAEGTPRTLDGNLHLLRIASLDRAVRAGVFLPRWQPEMLLGLGYPTLNYYAPASYYLIEALHLVGLSLLQAYTLTLALTLIAAGFGMYCLAKDTFRGNSWAALVAAVAYMSAPYLLINLYNRGAIAEAGAQALLPWILWSGRRLLTHDEPARYALLLALTLAGIATMHTISLLFAPVLLMAWVVVIGLPNGRLRARWPWLVGSILASMAASAFFWMPLILERGYLSDRGFAIARDVWLASGAWTWQSAVQGTWAYVISSARPVRLGLVQVILAVTGLIMARRRDAEWLFWIIVALASAALIGAWALPLWSGTILALAQFPWRLLSILSLPLAIATGGIVSGAPSGWPRIVAVAATTAILIAAHTPRIGGMSFLAPQNVLLDPAVLAINDRERGTESGGEGNSSVQEFRPRWAAPTFTPAGNSEQSSALPVVEVLAANAWDTQLVVSGSVPSDLRFSTFYFPGWRATIDGAAVQEIRAETSAGLLSVPVPAGEHALVVTWEGTWVERAANLVSLAAWIALALFCLTRPVLRVWTIFPLLLAAAGITGLLWTRTSTPVQQPLTPTVLPGIQLLGAQIDVASPERATIRPFWLVSDPPPEDALFNWQLQSSDGAILATYAARPWYNSGSTRTWTPGSVIDDGYLLPLPASLPAGDYRLAISLVDDAAQVTAPADQTALTPALAFHLDQPVPPNPAPEFPLHARFAESTLLAGYSLYVNGREILAQPPVNPTDPADPATAASAQPLVVVHPGDRVEYELAWQPDAPLYENVHSFVHLVDIAGAPVAQHDQAPGPLNLSPEAWLPGRVESDRHRLRIPNDAASGLLEPRVGLYTFATMERLPAEVSGTDAPLAYAPLPAIKVVAQPGPQHLTQIDAQIGDFATLTGFSVEPAGEIAPGSTISVTLRYRSDKATTQDNTRFLHLAATDAHGAPVLVAQSDALPQAGQNPTWSWEAGETIIETAPLTIAAGVPEGEYALTVGFYDRATQERIPLSQSGVPVSDNALPLATLHIGAAPQGTQSGSESGSQP